MGAASATAVVEVVEASAARPLSYSQEIFPIFSKAGCNAGACHGNKSGKGGFKLSLRGQDADADYLTLTRDLFARRLLSCFRV